MSLTRTDTKPWYRQFWPWFIFGLPGIVVVAALATVYIASRHADDLVVDDYYKEGLAINRRLEMQQAAVELGVAARLEITTEQVVVHLDGKMDTEELTLAFSHPLESDRDFTVIVQRSAPGTFEGELPSAVAPRWHWSLAPVDATRWRLDGVVISADFKHGSDG